MQVKTWKNSPEEVLRCSNWKCGAHYNAWTAYIPVHLGMSTWNEFLRIQYCWCMQLRIDQTVHFAGATENTVGRIFAANRDVTGWFTVHLSKGVEFRTGEVDMDAAKTQVDRSSGKAEQENTHRGRIFLMKERATGKKKVVPLRDMAVEKGTALPPESNDGIAHAIVSAMKDGSIACGDGAQA
eukprot:12430148-Karenia_brevis.AAC.1